jgi:hypothetical protein
METRFSSYKERGSLVLFLGQVRSNTKIILDDDGALFWVGKTSLSHTPTWANGRGVRLVHNVFIEDVRNGEAAERRVGSAFMEGELVRTVSYELPR